MLHMMKLAVGVRDPAHLRHVQAARAAADPPLRHRTRLFPKRAAELVAGGSIYWVVAGSLSVRQRILAVVADAWDDATPCAGLVLDPVLVAVEARGVRPFQGWRYLEPHAAPPDAAPGGPAPEDMPERMRAELRSLGLV
jgi:hypothetical protein